MREAIDISAVRGDTPGCANRVHLNNAGASLMPRQVLQCMIEHLELETQIGGYEAAESRTDLIDQSYDDIASLIGTRSQNVAVMANATAGFIQALSSFDFTRGDSILTTRCDYTSNQIQYLALMHRRGVVVRYAEDLPAGGVDPDSVRDILSTTRCRLVAVTWIPANSGLVQDVEEIGNICEEFDTPYLVDACQAVGQITVDVARLKCDYLSATARKFLRGPRGVGFLYASDKALARGDHPLYVDMRGARWVDAQRYAVHSTARRYEDWEFPYALVVGQGAAVRYAQRIGVSLARDRAWKLAAYLRERLQVLPGVRVLDRGKRQCAIVMASVEGWHAPDMVAALNERGVNVSASLREYSLFDFDQKRISSALRASPHYYNTEGDIDDFVDALSEIRRSGARQKQLIAAAAAAIGESCQSTRSLGSSDSTPSSKRKGHALPRRTSE